MFIADFVKNRLQEAPNWVNLPLIHLNRFGDRVYGGAMRKFKQQIPSINPEEKLVAMANYAIEHVPYYRKRYAGAIIKTADDFRRTFGFIDKDTVRDNYTDFISDEAASLPHVELRTSGTSGKPMRFLIPANRYVTEMAFVTGVWQHSGWNYDIKGTIRRKQLPAGRDYMVNPATREIIFDGNRSDEAYVRKVHRVLTRNRVHTLYGYPSGVMRMVRLFLKYGLSTSGIHRVLLTSESVPPPIYNFFTNLGIKIATFYGHTEKLVFIEQLSGAPTFAIEPGYGFCEIIGSDGKEAMEGEIVGTTFYNRVMPLLRYRTGDFARKQGTTAVIDGIEKPILSAVEGRREQTQVVRTDGTVLNLSSIEIHDEFSLKVDGVQFIQNEPGKLTVRVVPSCGYSQADADFMRQYYGKAMLGEENVTIEEADELILQPNGKALTVIRTVPLPQQ